MPTPVIPEAAPNGDTDLAPEFSLSAWIGENDPDVVDILVHVSNAPSAAKPASSALLYGLAILTLDKQDVISAQIDALCKDGVPSEASVIDSINLLLKADANDQPA